MYWWLYIYLLRALVQFIEEKQNIHCIRATPKGGILVDFFISLEVKVGWNRPIADQLQSNHYVCIEMEDCFPDGGGHHHQENQQD